MTPLIELDGVSVRRGDRLVLSDVTVSISAGRIVGVIGPNGAGKTTLIRTIGGRLPYQGSLRIAGSEVIDDPLRARQAVSIAAEPQGLSLHLTGLRYLGFIAAVERYAALTPHQAEMIALLDFASDIARPIKTYSHGMLKKLSIVASLNEAAPIYVYDEIFNGLDIVALAAMKSFFRSRVDAGKTVFICSHVLQVLFDWCDEVLLVSGATIARRWTGEALADYRGDYKAFESEAARYYR